MSATQLLMRKKMQRKNSAMADPVLKFPPEQKGSPPQLSREQLAATPRRRLLAALRRYRRFLLLVVLPVVAVIGGVAFYLNGGRYVGTDDTYVGAQKVLITPDISGRIDKVVVKEGQLVNKGDVLFEIDPVPFRLVLDRAKAAVEQAKMTYTNLGANIRIFDQMADLMQQTIDLKERDVNRKSTLAKSSYGSQLDLDNASTASLTARAAIGWRGCWSTWDWRRCPSTVRISCWSTWPPLRWVQGAMSPSAGGWSRRSASPPSRRRCSIEIRRQPRPWRDFASPNETPRWMRRQSG